MQAVAERYITEEEYWQFELASPEKHEYFNGTIYAMSGGSPVHAVLSANAIGALIAQLRGRPCRVATSDQRVKVEASGLNTYPDVVVYCPPFRFDANQKDTLLNPTLLIEVLLPSTRDYDRGEKFEHYQQIESLRDYLLIAQDTMRVDHYHRLDNGDWLLHTASTPGEVLELTDIRCALPLNDIYDGVEFDNTPRPLRDATPQREEETGAA